MLTIASQITVKYRRIQPFYGFFSPVLFAEEEECEDKDSECPKRATLCTRQPYREMREENSQRTCGLCAVKDMQRELRARTRLDKIREG